MIACGPSKPEAHVRLQMAAALRLILVFLASLVLVGALIWLSACGAFLWSVGTQELPEDVGFGYYRDFSIARKAIEASPCVDSIEYSRHEDVTLEDFHFMIRTRSGLWARLWFYEGVDVAAVCSKPEGFVVLHPTSQSVSQVYSDAELSTHLRERGIQVANVNDLLCNLDELARVFEPKYNNEANGRITHDYEAFSRYLYLEILGDQRANNYLYTRIR